MTEPGKPPGRRWVFIAAGLATVVIGLASRQVEWVPAWIGDVLWAVNVYFIVSVFVPDASRRWRGVVALAVSYIVEISQLYHQPWIDDIRRTTLGHLVLGTTFTWIDLVAYTAGVAVAMVVTDQFCERRTRSVSSHPDPPN